MQTQVSKLKFSITFIDMNNAIFDVVQTELEMDGTYPVLKHRDRHFVKKDGNSRVKTSSDGTALIEITYYQAPLVHLV